MPQVSRFRIAAVDELYRELRYASADARRRQMEAAERLVDEIVPDQVYPLDFVVYRITGYRPDRAELPPALVGEALVGDLVSFIQRLSRGLRLVPEEIGRRPVPLDEAARRLGVSARTLQRYRLRGLVCHYAVHPDGVRRLGCFEDSLHRFVTRHRDEVERASSFSRIDGDLRRRLIAEAVRAHRESGLSLNAAARRLAAKHGRAPETVRAILARHDRAAGGRVFGGAAPLGPGQLRLIQRATRFGVGVGVLARRLGKAPPTIHRALNRSRRARLAGLDLAGPPLPDDLDEDDVLDDPRLAVDLLAPPLGVDALHLVEAARRAPAGDGRDDLLARGYHLLERRVRARIGTLPDAPAGGVLDAVETDLRWATLIKCRLVHSALPAAIGAVEQTLGRPLAGQTTDEILAHLREAIEVASATIERHEPGRGTTAGAVGYAMSRALARAPRPRAGRAATRHGAGSVVLETPFERLTPWQPWLSLPPSLRALVDRLDPEAAGLLEQRYGLAGRRPLTLVELARRTGRTPSAAARLVRRAETALRRMRRG